MLASRFPVRLISTIVHVVVLSLVLLAAGCHKQPTRATPPVLIPSIESQPQPTSANSQDQPDEATNPTPDTTPQQPPSRDPQKPRPKPRKPIRKPIQPAPSAPTVSEPPKPEPAKPTAPSNSVQITADVPRAAVQSQKQNTEQLLRNSEGKLAHINRNLNDSEQGMLHQARNYITQSNQALQGGDTERAYNLAVKANLLANELAK